MIFGFMEMIGNINDTGDKINPFYMLICGNNEKITITNHGGIAGINIYF